MKKILFVNPQILNKELYGDLGVAGSSAYPLGLCSLAAVARKHGYAAQILDARVLGMNLEETVEEIIKINPDYLGLTAVTITIDRVAEVAAEIKKKNAGIKIILGGPHLTAVPEETFNRFKSFDLGVIGEGELTLIELLQKLDQGEDLNEVSGLIFVENGNLKLTKPRGFIENLDDLPMPAWDLLPNLTKFYHPTIYSLNRLPSTHLVTSRGCPGKCIFCDTAVFGKKFRHFSSEYVMKMIKELYYNYGIKDILFDDDLFMGNRKRLVDICNMLIEKKLNLTWSCNARVDFITKDILSLMKNAGCWQIAYGIESGSQRMLDYMGKNTNLNQIKEVLRWTRKAGIRTKGFFMMGYPIETKEDALQTIKFATEIDLLDFQINFFTPLPGSEAYKMTADKKLKELAWGDLNFHTEPVFIPEKISKAELMQLNKEAFRRFYLRPKIIISYLSMVKNWGNFLKLLKGMQALLIFLLPKTHKKRKPVTQ